MPTYEYACKQCGEHLDVVQSFSDDPLTTCPKCGGELRKVFGNVGIVFKGSGFYKTDSRSTNATAAPAANSTSENSPATTSSDAPSTPAPTPAVTSPAPAASAPPAPASTTKP